MVQHCVWGGHDGTEEEREERGNNKTKGAEGLRDTARDEEGPINQLQNEREAGSEDSEGTNGGGVRSTVATAAAGGAGGAAARIGARTTRRR